MIAVQRWDIITIGNLSRNRYWGESDDQAVRPALCTCTLITGDGFRLLVDPSFPDPGQMAAELDRRTGLRPEAIDLVLVTHEHGDHYAGLAHFAQARWLAAPPVAEALNASGRMVRPIEPTSGLIAGCVELIPTPGHTLSHHSLRFGCDGMSVAIAGDAVMTRDFWRERRGFRNSADESLVRGSMDLLERLATIIVPGHDNYFLTSTPSHTGEKR